MRKWLILAGLALALAPAVAEARRRGIPIVYNMGHTRVEQVAALPDTAAFRGPAGHVDLGWAYSDYSIFWIPFGYGAAEGYVLSNGEGYYVLEPKDYPEIARLTGVDLSQPHPLGMLGHLWGWLLVLLLGGLVAWRKFSRNFQFSMHAPSYEGARTAAPPPQPESESVRQRGFGRKGAS
jgi:hypothetical protein